jgi:hypothetical protein
LDPAFDRRKGTVAAQFYHSITGHIEFFAVWLDAVSLLP